MLKTHPDASFCSTRAGMHLFHPSAFTFPFFSLYRPSTALMPPIYRHIRSYLTRFCPRTSFLLELCQSQVFNILTPTVELVISHHLHSKLVRFLMGNSTASLG